MKVCIAGGSGFIGRNLVKYLNNTGHEIDIITRKDFEQGSLGKKLYGCEILINLMGEPITGIWTIRKKDRIYRSRVETTRKLVACINESGIVLELIIGVSGIAIYDNSHEHDEESTEFSSNFLSGVIMDWEGEYANLERSSIRVCILRLGVVLGKDGGLFEKIDNVFKRRIGFVIDSNEDFSFIHIEDLLAIFDFVMKHGEIVGIVNANTPTAISILRFFEVWTDIRKCFIVINLIEPWLRFLWGEAADVLVIGQNVKPVKLLRSGFIFNFPNAEMAINDLL